MKGFVHIVEMLLVIMLIFMVFTQFSAIPAISGDWPKIKLSTMADDLLEAMDRKGVDWLDGHEVESELNRTLPGNIIYSVTLENVIMPEIRVGCLCDDGQMGIMDNILGPKQLTINGQNVTFELIQVQDKDELFALDFDVAIVYGYEDFSQSPYGLRNFLGYGKGVVEIFDPPAIDSVQRTYFGLDSGSVNAGTGNVRFSGPGRENGMEVNMIYDYFTHFPVFYDDLEDSELDKWSLGFPVDYGEFSGFGNPGHSVKLTGNSENNFISTKYYRSFENGDIDFDVYLADGASVFVGFAKGGGKEYMAGISSNGSSGHDSFYRKYPLESMGTNTSHNTEYGKWSHIKIRYEGSQVYLYSNGDNVAVATVARDRLSNITVFNLNGDAYVDNMRVTYEEGHMFGNFLDPGENTTQSAGDGNRVLLRQAGTDLPACIINYNVEGNGRTVWLSNSSSYSDDYRTLVKSLISWAAGDRYSPVKSDLRSPVSSYIYRTYNRDMFQNVKISLELGYLY